MQRMVVAVKKAGGKLLFKSMALRSMRVEWVPSFTIPRELTDFASVKYILPVFLQASNFAVS